MLKHIDLNLLETLQSIARTKSVKATAAEMSVTSSAISQALMRLEEQTGTQLFLREHKKIKISPAGKELLLKVGAPLNTIYSRLAEFSAQATAESAVGTVSVGCPSELGTTFMIKWFSTLQLQYPGVKIKLRLGSPRSLLAYLENGEVDFLIADDGPYYSDLSTSLSIEKIFSEELVVCVSKRFNQKIKVEPSFDGLVKLPHLDYSSDGSAIGIWYKHIFKRVPRRLDLVLVSENVRALISGIQQDVGIGMIPKYLVNKELESGSLVQILPKAKPLLNSILLVQHQSKIPTATEKIFLTMIKSKRNLVF